MEGFIRFCRFLDNSNFPCNKVKEPARSSEPTLTNGSQLIYPNGFRHVRTLSLADKSRSVVARLVGCGPNLIGLASVRSAKSFKQ